MRVCIVSPNKQAYSETFIKAHIDRLDEVVSVLYGGHLPTHIMGNDQALLDPSAGSRIKRAVASKLAGRSIEELQREAIAAHLRDQKIELVLAEYGPTGVELMQVCASLKIPLVTHFHGIDAYHVDILKKYERGYQELFNSHSELIAVSKHMEQKLLDLGAPRSSVHYNVYGVDIERFSKGDPGNSGLEFLSIGRFTDKKAPFLTILAFAEILKEFPDAKLTMVGDGALWDPCKKLVIGLGLENAIDLPGVVGPDMVAAKLGSARAFVQHSLTPANNDHEGTPLAVIEASASGVPVISTTHAGIPDVVEHEVTGLLSAENDLGAMVANLKRLAKDKNLAGEMGEAGRQKAVAEFNVNKSIAGLQEILENALKSV